MATSPPLSPLIAATNSLRVEDWIQQLPEQPSTPTETISPPLTPVSNPSPKRKRATSLRPCTYTMSTRTTSPKRRRGDDDGDGELLPTHSVSAAGAASSASPIVLNEGNTFSPPSSQFSTKSTRRANSPSRDDIATLAFASPPTITEPRSQLKDLPPQRVSNVMARLKDGLDRGWIPVELRKLIEEDQDYKNEDIEPHAWSESTTHTLLDPVVDIQAHIVSEYVLQKVKQIWSNALVCELKGRDENAWCNDVMQPLMKLAMRLAGDGKFWLQSVQSQAINLQYLSIISDDSVKSRLLERKADFTLSFSHLPSPGLKDLYIRLRAANKPVVSHMADAFTKTTALFSCVEVKPSGGSSTQAAYQLSIWMAASLRKKMELARRVGLLDKCGLVEPCFTIVGHDVRVYFAYVASEAEDTVRILGPELGSFLQCQTGTVSGIFRTLRLWQNAIRYGRDEGTEGFWGSFMGPILQRLAGDVDEGLGAPLASAALHSHDDLCIRTT